MAKLTKAQAKQHQEAERILQQDKITDDDRLFVIEHWQESANHINSAAGAFFTPFGLARDAALDIPTSGRVIDLCAGIGTLSLASWWRGYQERSNTGYSLEIVCVELNPAYVEIGRKMLPEAQWVCASIFQMPDLGHFDCAVSNPPFGVVEAGPGFSGKYTGAEFEFKTIELASRIADSGVFIVPQQSAGFRYSGAAYFDRYESPKYQRFRDATGITLDIGAGVDTSYYRDQWHGVSPTAEIACADFSAVSREELPGRPDLALF